MFSRTSSWQRAVEAIALAWHYHIAMFVCISLLADCVSGEMLTVYVHVHTVYVHTVFRAIE